MFIIYYNDPDLALIIYLIKNTLCNLQIFVQYIRTINLFYKCCNFFNTQKKIWLTLKQQNQPTIH